MPKIKLKWKKDKRTALDKEIDRILESMSEYEVQTSDEYRALRSELSELTDIKAKTASMKERIRIDPNVCISAFTTITTALLIMNHEELHVLSTKAFAFIPRPRF